MTQGNFNSQNVVPKFSTSENKYTTIKHMIRVHTIGSTTTANKLNKCADKQNNQQSTSQTSYSLVRNINVTCLFRRRATTPITLSIEFKQQNKTKDTTNTLTEKEVQSCFVE